MKNLETIFNVGEDEANYIQTEEAENFNVINPIAL